MLRTITPPEAKKLLDSGEGYVYVDVRTPEEFRAAHIPGAHHLPVALDDPATGERVFNEAFVTEISAHFPKNAKLILGCRTGSRSDFAGRLLEREGYQVLCNMDGGLAGRTDMFGRVIVPGWEMLGYPLSRGAEGVGDAGSEGGA